ncbi:MAG: CGNR zinc finger domain-containing protein [Thermomicrobiales bacterium]
MPRSSVASNGPIAKAHYRELRGGALCLDFINTVDRHAPDVVPAYDYLAPGYANLLAWCTYAEVIDERTRTALLRLARKDGRKAAAVRKRAAQLRDALFTIARAIRLGEPDPTDALEVLSSELEIARAHQRVVMSGGQLAWKLSDTTSLDAVIWPIAISAMEVLGSESVRRIGECESIACEWLFIDTSKNRSRRFCSATGCGNATRIRRFRARAAETVPASRDLNLGG